MANANPTKKNRKPTKEKKARIKINKLYQTKTIELLSEARKYELKNMSTDVKKSKSPKKYNYPPKKLKTQEERDEWRRKKNQVKEAKSEITNSKIDNYQRRVASDQNYGTHDMKGRFIKKMRYNRRTKNPKTPFREYVLVSTALTIKLNEYGE
jgi:hypothetical protein